MRQDELAARLREQGCTVLMDEPMSAHTSFRIGGPADLFVIAQTDEQIAAVQSLCYQEMVPLLFLGNGSNLLVSDDGIAGVVLQREPSAPLVTGCTVMANAGLSLGKLCQFAWENALSGLEFAFGIPGTVGGGIYMNAGAYGGELADVAHRVTVLKPDGTVETVSASAMDFGYRHSVCMEQDWIILSAEFELVSDRPEDIRGRMDEFLSRRKAKQPLEYPSGGSFFKRPTGYFAGALIEQCGLKGFAVGGAQVSEKHAGFVINRGGATCADVMELCCQVQDRVFREYGVKLEREVQLVGR